MSLLGEGSQPSGTMKCRQCPMSCVGRTCCTGSMGNSSSSGPSICSKTSFSCFFKTSVHVSVCRMYNSSCGGYLNGLSDVA